MSKVENEKSRVRTDAGQVNRFRRWIKPISQWCCLGLFIYCFARTAYPFDSPFSVEGFLTMDPLIALCTVLSDWRLPPGLLAACVLLIGTFFLGRYFCGYICPIGALIDGVDVLTRSIRKRIPIRIPPALLGTKFFLMAVILVCALFGSVQFLWLDPLSMATRFATQFAYTPVAARLAAESAEEMPVIRYDAVTFALLVLLLLPTVVQSRFWCRNLCPLGALLAVVGRRGRLPWVTEECVRCSRCVETCAMGAIDAESIRVSNAECHQCMRCSVVCPVDAVNWAADIQHVQVRAAASNETWSRRRFMGTITSAAAVAAATHLPVHASLRMGRGETLLRPPGASDESIFLKRCVRCGECMKVCPVRALQPVRSENGLAGIGSPHFRMRDAGCHPECNGCGLVCPTRAIPPLPLRRKNRACIGLVKVDHETCLLSSGRMCNICRNVCVQTGHVAIRLKPSEGFLRVEVNKDRCVGCGWCEFACPVNGGGREGEERGPAAIKTVARTDGVTRHREPW